MSGERKNVLSRQSTSQRFETIGHFHDDQREFRWCAGGKKYFNLGKTTEINKYSLDQDLNLKD